MNYRVAVKIIAFGVGAASLSLAALILWYGLAAEGLPGIAQEEGLMTATLSVLPWLLIIVAGLIGTNRLWALSGKSRSEVDQSIVGPLINASRKMWVINVALWFLAVTFTLHVNPPEHLDGLSLWVTICLGSLIGAVINIAFVGHTRRIPK